MRSSIFRQVLLVACVFFFINLLMLLSIKGFHPNLANDEQNEKLDQLEKSVMKNKKNSKLQRTKTAKEIVLPIVVFACNRPQALRKHVEGLLKIRKNSEKNPIIVSLDCNDQSTLDVAKTFKDKIKTIIKLPDLGPLRIEPGEERFSGYYRIARHYGYALNHVLNVLDYEAMIITEDDLEVSPDFLDYFRALYNVMQIDPTIWCISAWNDNGIDEKIEKNPTLLHRTDFFPGLGWLLKKTIWNEIKGNWPKTFWDDWMRKDEQRRNRSCIRPEISRSGISPEGKSGVSGGQFYDEYLKNIHKNKEKVDWLSMDLGFLEKSRYDFEFEKRIDRCPIVTIQELNSMKISEKCGQIFYRNNTEFVTIANALGLMNDLKSGVPRTAYRGVVQSRFGKIRIYIRSSEKPWTHYTNEQ